MYLPQQDQKQPTAQEQEMLELINRMRLKPSDELNLLLNSSDISVNFALDYFNVNIDVLNAQWLNLKPVQPLAWSNELIDAAQDHNALIIQEDTQSHQLPGELTLGQRVAATGYNWSAVGENVYAFGKSIFHSHASFAIDWGFTSTGIQESHGHRNNIMNNNFREIGLSVIPENDPTTSVGSLVTTQNFGSRFNFGNSWLLGVVFDDQTVDDNFYTVGEGLAEIDVTAVHTTTNQSFTTTTLAAGGYQMQLPDGTYQVTFSGDWNNDGQTDSETQQVTIGSENVKLDLKTDELSIAPVPTPTPTPDTDSGSTPTPTPVPTSDSTPVPTPDTDSDSTPTPVPTSDSTPTPTSVPTSGSTPTPTPEPASNDAIAGNNSPIEDTTANDDLSSGTGHDTVAGGLGDDVIRGGDGDDVLRGDLNSRSPGGAIGGDDIIYGGKGNDRIGGKGGNDQLYGQDDNDQIWGDNGDDLLWGGLGNDTLTGDNFSGGRGSDTFVLAAGEGTDTIIDFHIGEDFLGLANGLRFEELTITQGTGANAKNTLIDFGGETLAIINNVDSRNLMAVAEVAFTQVK